VENSVMQTNDVANDLGPRLDRIEALLSRMSAQTDRLDRGQALIGEAWDEAMPIGRDMMGVAIEKMSEAESRGWLRLGRGLATAADVVAAETPEAELAELGPRLVRLLQATDALTQPEVLDVLVAAAAQLRSPETLQPLGAMDLMRAMREDDVQRGIAVVVELLRGLGQAGRQLSEQPPARRSAPRPLERPVRPPRPVVRAPSAAAPEPAAPGVDPNAVVLFEGLRFRADGTLLEPERWTPELAAKLAPGVGVATLTDRHWTVVDFARAEYAAHQATPNIRRIGSASGVSIKELYQLFPTAPARAVARVAGLPKPVGCV